ncbi:MAG: methyl-accepting chemotaxis protein [FCB group bacterium]
MFNNMKIGLRLTLGFAIVVILAIVLIFLSLSNLSEINESVTLLVHDRFPKTVLSNEMIGGLNEAAKVTRNIILSEDPQQIKEQQSRLKEIASYVTQRLDSLKKVVKTEKGKELIQHYLEVREKYYVVRKKAFDLKAQGNTKEAINIVMGELNENEKEYIQSIRDLIDYQTDMMINDGENSRQLYISARNMLIIISISIVILSILIALFITRSITKPINLCVEAANKIADGEMNVNLETKSKDETGILINSMKKMATSIKNLVLETNSLVKSAIDGKLDKRADDKKHQGEYKTIIQGFNQTLDAIIGPLNVAAEYVDRISKGDIPPRITDEYKGDFNEIKNNLNLCIDGLFCLVEAEKSLRAIALNNYGIPIKGNYQGIFNNLSECITDTQSRLLGLQNSIAEIAEGNFDALEEYKKVGKRCEYDQMLPAIIKMMENIKTTVTDINLIVIAATDGKLDIRTDTSKHQGEFKKVVEGVNKILDAVIEPINEAGSVLSVMATGDLTVRIEGNYNGEYKKLKDSINTVNNSLNNLLREVNEAVQSTSSSSLQISSTSETMAAGAAEQSAQADEVASAVEEMSRTITQNATSATKTAEVAERNGKIAKEGEDVVDQTVSKMKDIADVVKKSAFNIEKLGQSSQEIGEIISVIDDIADQTNLLALNAAIEAARAGDQGRGFAVVADEVRKLAERTTEATKQIANMIKGIQKETVEAVSVMQKGNEEVSNGISLADRAGKSLSEVVKSSQEVQNMITQIAAASEEQSATSEQITRNVLTISSVSAESARNVQDIAASANNLAKLTEHLSSLMGQFSIDLGNSSDIKSSGNGNGRKHHDIGNSQPQKLGIKIPVTVHN